MAVHLERHVALVARHHPFHSLLQRLARQVLGLGLLQIAARGVNDERPMSVQQCTVRLWRWLGSHYQVGKQPRRYKRAYHTIGLAFGISDWCADGRERLYVCLHALERVQPDSLVHGHGARVPYLSGIGFRAKRVGVYYQSILTVLLCAVHPKGIGHKLVVSLEIARPEGYGATADIRVALHNAVGKAIHFLGVVELHIEVHVADGFLHAQQYIVDVRIGTFQCVFGPFQRIFFHRLACEAQHDK